MSANALANLPWPASTKLLRAPGCVGCLPIGATEAHGPHLPLGTDVFLSVELAERVVTALEGQRPALVLPPISYSVTRYAAGFAGTIGVSPESARGLIVDILAAVHRHGLATVALINSHLEPDHVALLDSVADECRPPDWPRVVFVNHCRKPWALELGDEFKSGDCHAGAYETSLLLASRYAEHVRTDAAARLEPRYVGLVRQMKSGVRSFEAMGAADAYFGDPARATAEEGERLWGVQVRMWVEAIAECT